VTVHEVGEFREQPYFVMQYVEGQSLRDVTKTEETSIDRVVDLLIQICDGLREAHEAGIVHRDIKPSNILIDSKGKPKLADFGLAAVRGADELTKTGSTLGTVGYMSPEQAQSREVDHRSDLFSLGIVIYEMLTGWRPFRGEDEAAVLHSITHETPEPLARYKTDVPDELQRIVTKLLEKDMSHRYQSAAGIISDLKRLAIASHVKKPSARATGKSRLLRIGVPLLMVAMIALAAVAVKPWMWWAAHSDKIISTPKRLAVLYLQNRGSPDDEYLSYGITEDLIVDLTRIGTFGVTPMRSIVKYKDSDVSLERVAQELQVSLVVDGSIRRQDSVVSVSIQLVDVQNQENLWAERWSQDVEGLPHIKESLAKGITRALEIDSSAVHVAEIGYPDAENPVAYDFYLRGKYVYLDKTDVSDVDVALGLFRKALELEPTLTAARIGAAQALKYKGELDQAIEELTTALSQARERSRQSEEAQSLLLLAQINANRVLWDGAFDYINQALEISRAQGDLCGEARALRVYVGFLNEQNRLPETFELFERIVDINQQLDDQSALRSTLHRMGNTLKRMGKLDSAEVLYGKSLEIAIKRNNQHAIGALHNSYGTLYSDKGESSAALEHYVKALDVFRRLDNPVAIAAALENLGRHHGLSGNYREYRDAKERAAVIYLELQNTGRYSQCMESVAAASLNLGEYDHAIAIYSDNLEAWKELGNPYRLALTHQNLAFAYFYKGEAEAAGMHLYTALQMNEQMGADIEIAFNAASLSEFYYFQADLDSSRKYAERSLAIIEDATDHISRILSSAYLSAVRVREGYFDSGVSQLTKLAGEADSLGFAELVVISKRLLGQALVESGRTDSEQSRGRDVLAEALSLAKDKSLAHEIRWIGELMKE
jgi:TolB-like protein/Tfp pilus assembly protein PilF